MTENLLPESLVCSFRWVKFEEDVEDGSNRWSKPHVATLSLHSLFELRNLLTKGTILLDMEASKYEINFIHLLDSFLIVALITLSNVLGFLLFFHEYLSSPNSKYRDCCPKFATGLIFCQNDPLMGESLWQKDSFVTLILFDLCLF